MATSVFPFRSKVWKYPGMAGWRFLTLSKTTSATIRKQYRQQARGWGSLPVLVSIGTVEWKTSIFPDKKSACYLLPLKSAIRKKVTMKDDQIVRGQVSIDISKYIH
jgi:hypothetical protein